MGDWSESISTSLEPRKVCALVGSCLRDIENLQHGWMMEVKFLTCCHLVEKKEKLGLTFASHGAQIQGRESSEMSLIQIDKNRTDLHKNCHYAIPGQN